MVLAKHTYCQILAIHDIYVAGWAVTEKELEEAATKSGILETSSNEYVPKTFRDKCNTIIPAPEEINSADCATAFCYLKDELKKRNSTTN